MPLLKSGRMLSGNLITVTKLLKNIKTFKLIYFLLDFEMYNSYDESEKLNKNTEMERSDLLKILTNTLNNSATTSTGGSNIVRSKIVEPRLENKHQSENGKINFSFELLQIHTKEFREKVWSNNVLYFFLVALFIVIIVFNYHHSLSSFKFCSLMCQNLFRSFRTNIIERNSGQNERVRYSDVLRKGKHSDKRGFNRLPQNEEESDLVIQDLSEDDDSDILEDFSPKNCSNKII